MKLAAARNRVVDLSEDLDAAWRELRAIAASVEDENEDLANAIQMVLNRAAKKAGDAADEINELIRGMDEGEF